MQPGDVVGGKYEIVRPIGRGGMGEVFEARHAELGRPLAIKFLRVEVADERDVIERFFREARVASSLSHPRIVDVFDVGWTDDGELPWFAMELLEGESLASGMAKGAAVPVPRTVSIVAQVLDALEAAHARGIVHRDLKPENVFLRGRGDDAEVKVLDFGISKVLDRRITVTGVVLGTPTYMSPEQARGASDVDHRTDIYAAGAILFELLAGRPPFGGANYHQVLVAIMAGERPTLGSLRPTLHPGLTAIVERALAKDPNDRWPTAAAMRDALLDVMDSIDALVSEGYEPSLVSEVKTRAWTPSPQPSVAPEPEPEPEPEPAEDARDEPAVVSAERSAWPIALLVALVAAAATVAALAITGAL